jgi:hypothetical protein
VCGRRNKPQTGHAFADRLQNPYLLTNRPSLRPYHGANIGSIKFFGQSNVCSRTAFRLLLRMRGVRAGARGLLERELRRTRIDQMAKRLMTISGVCAATMGVLAGANPVHCRGLRSCATERDWKSPSGTAPKPKFSGTKPLRHRRRPERNGSRRSNLPD